MLVIAAEPAPARAAAGREAHARQSSAPDARSVGPVVLGFGSGYGGGVDAVRVRALQRRLDRAGYSPGPVDGRYGPRTERAVEQFQIAHGLRADGIAGPLTLAALRAPASVLFPGAGYARAGSGAVRALQRQLRHDGYSPGPIDGRYGPRTERAVARLQAAHGLRADGIAGPQTYRELARIATRQRPATHPRPGRKLHPTPSHPGSPQATRSPAPASRPGSATNRYGGSSWPELLVLAGLVGLTACATGGWLLDRRRRKSISTALEPSVHGAALDPEGAQGSEPAQPMAELSSSSGSEQSPEPGHATIPGRRLEERDESAEEPAYRDVDPNGDAAGAFELGVLLERDGDLPGARDAFQQADEQGDGSAANNLGVLLEGDGDLAAAEAAYRRADQRGDAAGAFNLGALLANRGDRAGAIAAFQRADHRGDLAAPSNLGVLLEQDGDLSGAADAYRRGAARGDPTAAFNLGLLLEGHGDPDGALRAYQRAQRSGDREIVDMARARAVALVGAEEGQR